MNCSTIVVEKVDSSQRFGTLKDEWNELLKDSTSDCLFLTWEWLHTWWKHLAGDRRLNIITVRIDGRLAAIAPLVQRSSQWRRLLPFPVLEFLGSGSVGSDYLDILVRRGQERQALAALAESLAGGKLMLEFSQVERSSAQAIGLALQLKQQGWIFTRHLTDFCPYIDLSGHDWESYLASLGSAHRYNLRRRIRNLEKQWSVRFERVQSEEQRTEALRELVRLHETRWRARNSPGVFHDPALVAFHDELSRLALRRGWLRLYVLRLDGRPVAALYGFNYHNTFYFYQSGFDPGYGRHSVGLVIMGLAIKSAIEEGLRVYDFLRGDESYKMLWTRDERELVRLGLYPSGEYGMVYRQAMELRWGIKNILSRYLPAAI